MIATRQHSNPFGEDDMPNQADGSELGAALHSLPTYDAAVEDSEGRHLAGARFGRWRSWIEKRSRERRLTMTSEPAEVDPLPEYAVAQVDADGSVSHLPQIVEAESSLPQLHPTHLTYRKYGSRFIPHSTTTIHCVLPTMDGSLLLYGTADGLMAMRTSAELDVDLSVSKVLLAGEAFLQMQVVSLKDEVEPGKTPHGSLLVLVQPCDHGARTDHPDELPSGPAEPAGPAQVRLYQLGSLVSLARCAFAMDDFTALDTTSVRDSPPRGSISAQLKSPRPLSGMSSMRGLLSRQRSTSSRASTCSTLFAMSEPVQAEEGASGFMGMAREWATDYEVLAGGPSCSLGLRQEEQILSFCLHSKTASLVSARPDIIVATVGKLVHLKSRDSMDQYTVAGLYDLPQRPVGMQMLRVGKHGTCTCQSKYHNGQCEYLRRLRLQTSTMTRAAPEMDAPTVPHVYVDFASGSCMLRLSDGKVFDIAKPGKTGRKDRERRQIEPRVTLSVVSDPIAGPSLVIKTCGSESEVLPHPITLPLSSNMPLCRLSWDAAPARVTGRYAFIYRGHRRILVLQLIATRTTGEIELQEVDLVSVVMAHASRQDLQQWQTSSATPFAGGSTRSVATTGTRGEDAGVQKASMSLGIDSRILENGPGGTYMTVQKARNDWRIFRLGSV